ncbi:hypothetical protein P43SY_003308 [Pythium insidiosum]|uniref:GPI transamidase component PIG-S n=1 Tax=Pythium insidiosum TaxID=114742 RepID=A0AAD5LWW1_PYTIN|nr:hypothetical protein P43SY_003308 [Pythium insidiosum]
MAGSKLQIVTCFVVFAALVAPFAWQLTRLTRVERVDLPVDRIHALSWEDSRVGRIDRHSVQLVFVSDGEQASHADESSALATALSSMRVSVADQRQQKPLAPSRALRDALRSRKDEQVDDALHQQQRSVARGDETFTVFFICEDVSEPVASTVVVGQYRHAWAYGCVGGDRHAAVPVLRRLLSEHVFRVPPTTHEQTRDTRRARVADKYRLQFTLLQERADTPWTWDFDAWQRRYVAPLLQKVGSLAEFTVEHQVVHFARLAQEIHWDDAGKFHFVQADDLRHFKSTNDFLTSSVLADREQVLHFMVALPAPEHSPLQIRATAPQRRVTSSFAIPGWGLATIVRPDLLAASAEAEAQELQRVAGLVVSQFRTLFGLPAHHARRPNEDITFLPARRDGVAQWELDAITRQLLQSHVRSAVETLQSIVRLVTDMPEMTVHERLQQRIVRAADAMEKILCANCSAVRADDAPALLESARRAADEADAVYYDHTMTKQLYFPQEQMLGVYAPLLAPLLLSIVFGWIREFKQWRKQQRQQKHQPLQQQ